MPRSAFHVLVASAVFGVAAMALGQDFPSKPIRIVTSEAGGGSDFVARLVAQGLAASLAQQVIVDNRGGSAVIPAQIVAKAPPDGYTLLFFGPTLWVLPFLQDNVPYDPLRDFSPISAVARSPNVLVVHPSLPVKSVKELIALAKARPGELNYAGALPGSTTHISAELFKSMANVDIVRIPFKGNGPSVIGVVAGQVQLMFASPSGVVPHVKSGRLRALAVTSAQTTALLPGLPTVSATGLPGYESVSLQGIHAPFKTPAAIVHRLSQETALLLKREDLKEKFFSAGLDTVGSSPEEFSAKMKIEMARLGKLIKDAGIKAD